ncbi:MAG TPA: hypothetical protein VFN83_03640 [Gemmatimonadales bacterium]|jgi:hypothetical protein|nr:hypothetical protein [Gemmatimonadales bacterium]
MSSSEFRRRTLDSLKKEAKQWHAAVQAGETGATMRLRRVLAAAPANPALRDVQLALAREQGFPGWSDLKHALAPDPGASARSLARYQAMADALLEAYRTGTPEAMERHYRLTWHRRPWRGMRAYVQLDLGKRPAPGSDDVEITLDDARHLVAREHGFDDWDALRRFVAVMPGGIPMAAKPVRVARGTDPEHAETVFESRDWDRILQAGAAEPDLVLDARGQMTDAVLAGVASLDTLQVLGLGGSKAVTDEGIRHLARMPRLRRLDLSGTAVTDQGLAALGELTSLERISLSMTRVTDQGVRHLARCHALRHVDLAWTRTGDGALRALAGKPHLGQLRSGNEVSDAGLALLHQFPVFKSWQGGEIRLALTSYEAEPNQLLLRGPFTDAGMAQLRGLDGLFGLNLDARELGITAAAMEALCDLPHLGMLAVDAKDDWMPWIARMPALRFLGIQDTEAGDDGFTALAASRSIERIWGRRCHNLRTRGFKALARMPALQGLSVSCLNVADEGVALLPEFPALRELMPMDIPDTGYRHVGKCEQLESLVLMYCRDTTDAATGQITGLRRLTSYFNSYTTVTDRTPALLSQMDSLERITFDACHGLTNAGIAQLARLPRLRELSVAGAQLTRAVADAFPPRVTVKYWR